MEIVVLPLLGLAVGALGTFVGAGGGFVLVPVLLALYPDDPPEVITTISLAVVFLNALSGSAAYGYQRRIDIRSGLLFSATAIPGSILGAWAVRLLSPEVFTTAFGALMIAIAVFIMVRPATRAEPETVRPGYLHRAITDRAGHRFMWSYPVVRGVALSFIVGVLSSMLGIGGGIIHVPILVMVLNFPIHIATATSQFVLAITALTGTLTHIAAGEFQGVIGRTLLLGIGMIAGAQAGASLAPRVRPVVITRSLAAGLAVVGTRLLLRVIIG